MTRTRATFARIPGWHKLIIGLMCSWTLGGVALAEFVFPDALSSDRDITIGSYDGDSVHWVAR